MKRRANAGESIAETLVAVLIMALCFLMLATAVMAAARMNNAIKNKDVAFDTASAGSDEVIDDAYAVNITIGDKTGSVSAALHKTANGYYYYE